MTTTNKILGYGTLVTCDPAGGTTYVSVGSLKAISPAERKRKAADGTTLDDSRDVMDPAQEEATPFEFTQFFRPGDTNQIIMDTLYDNKAVASWQVVYPNNGQVTWEEFDGWVQGIGITIGDNSGYSMRKVTVMTTTRPVEVVD